MQFAELNDELCLNGMDAFKVPRNLQPSGQLCGPLDVDGLEELQLRASSWTMDWGRLLRPSGVRAVQLGRDAAKGSLANGAHARRPAEGSWGSLRWKA